MENILTSDFAVQTIYPFLLVFVLIFAILQKTKILGEDKRQIDALVSLAIALIVITVGWATDIITNLMPWLAVAVVVLLVFMVLFGFVAASNEKGLVMHKNLKIGIGVLAGIFVVVAVIVSTGQWDTVYNSLFGGEGISDVWSSVLLIAIIVGALAVAIFSGKGGSGGKNSEE